MQSFCVFTTSSFIKFLNTNYYSLNVNANASQLALSILTHYQLRRSKTQSSKCRCHSFHHEFRFDNRQSIHYYVDQLEFNVKTLLIITQWQFFDIHVAVCYRHDDMCNFTGIESCIVTHRHDRMIVFAFLYCSFCYFSHMMKA